MTSIQKFRTDVQRLIKHFRAENPTYNTEKVCNQIIQLFERESTCPGTLPGAIAQYWKEEYVDTSSDKENEPTLDNINILSAMLSFVEGTEEDSELLSNNDWQNLAELVNYEAEELPIDILQTLMSTLVSQNAL